MRRADSQDRVPDEKESKYGNQDTVVPEAAEVPQVPEGFAAAETLALIRATVPAAQADGTENVTYRRVRFLETSPDGMPRP